jgi:RNA polymerase sigma-70 factor (ECF subfamily)
MHRARRLLQRGLSSDLSTALTGVFNFDGERCDRLVAGVFNRLNGVAAL